MIDLYSLHDSVCHQALHLYHGISFQKHQKDNKLDGKKIRKMEVVYKGGDWAIPLKQNSHFFNSLLV